MHWYNREIKKYFVDMSTKIYAWIIIALSFSVYFYFTKWIYQWENIEIIPFIPWIWWLISALTYLTVWKLLYKSKVIYMPLYFIFVVILRDKRTYKKIKEVIWLILWLLMYFFFLPIAVSFLNFIISIFYNCVLFMFYLTPAFMISGFLLLGFIYINNKVWKR